MMNRRSNIKFITIVCLVLMSLTAYSATAYLKQFDFNQTDALSKWGRMILNGQVNYVLMKRGDNGYVDALSEKTCSAIYYRLGFKAKDYPVLSWKWRVIEFPDKSSAKTEKDKDDYAARVYVIFPFLSFSSSKFIEYVWDKDLPRGTVMKSPEGDNIRLIVVRSGNVEGKEELLSERRNIYDDYIIAFGKKPTLGVGAIAIMCDADSTKSRAQSLFDDIIIGSETVLKREVK